MKYITKINETASIVHVIDCGSGNVQVKLSKTPEHYGAKKGEDFWIANDIKGFNDLTVNCSNCVGGVHLAQIVLAIEQVKFVMEQTK